METKPGVVTTEFWITLFTNLVSMVVGIATLIGVDLQEEPLLAIVPAAAFFAATIASAVYAISRARTKQAEIAVAVEANREQKAWDLAVLAGDHH